MSAAIKPVEPHPAPAGRLDDCLQRLAADLHELKTAVAQAHEAHEPTAERSVPLGRLRGVPAGEDLPGNCAQIGGRTAPDSPDPQVLRRIIRHRRLRANFFGTRLFADPAWDMLLDLAAAHAEHKRVPITSLCAASAVPATTALRWIRQLIEAGLAERMEDDADRRRAFISLTPHGAGAMARYFDEIGTGPVSLV